MLKNRFFSIFAVAALVGMTACAQEEPETEVLVDETPAVDATAPVVEPAPVVEGTEPVVVDTGMVAPMEGAETPQM